MRASLVSLLDGLIDYAGLFPPANLEMSATVDHYLRYTQGAESWFVSRFVCPASRLPEFLAELEKRPAAPEIPLSVIGNACSNLDEWYETLEHDAKAMSVFVKEAGMSAALEAYEVKLPSHSNIDSCIRDLNSFQEVDVFVELPWGAGMDDSLAALAETEWLAAKARTGGQSAEAFPSVGDLAHFIHGAVALDLSFKLTAGLHHPLPRIDRQTGGKMHGFLNVLAASGFAYAHDMARVELEQVLQSTSLEDWRFDDKKLSWKGQTITIEDIEDSRDILWSIGSCSVTEALDDLDVLGLVAGGK